MNDFNDVVGNLNNKMRDLEKKMMLLYTPFRSSLYNYQINKEYQGNNNNNNNNNNSVEGYANSTFLNGTSNGSMLRNHAPSIPNF